MFARSGNAAFIAGLFFAFLVQHLSSSLHLAEMALRTVDSFSPGNFTLTNSTKSTDNASSVIYRLLLVSQPKHVTSWEDVMSNDEIREDNVQQSKWKSNVDLYSTSRFFKKPLMRCLVFIAPLWLARLIIIIVSLYISLLLYVFPQHPTWMALYSLIVLMCR